MGEEERVDERTHVSFVIAITEERRTTEVESRGKLPVCRGEFRDDRRGHALVTERDERRPRGTLLHPGPLLVGDVLQHIAEPRWSWTTGGRGFEYHHGDVLRSDDPESVSPDGVEPVRRRLQPAEIEDPCEANATAAIEDDESHTTKPDSPHREHGKSVCGDERHREARSVVGIDGLESVPGG